MSSVAIVEQGNSSSGIPVDGKLLKHMTSLKMLWSVSQQMLVPDHDPVVCGRVVMQVPPLGYAGSPLAAAPGIYYFDCNQPASFICQCKHIERVADMLAAQRKRTQGKPYHGPVSVVVTDIQSYTQLMHTLPDDMAKASVNHVQQQELTIAWKIRDMAFSL
eukprot:gene8033-8229_t